MNPERLRVELPGGAVRTHGSRSLWLQQELGQPEPSEHQPLAGERTTDVCIIGGGFAGLWTALELRRRAPGTTVTVIEADICGAGASGRNGGFALTWWAHFEHLVALCGAEQAVVLARRAEQAVRSIGEFCRDRGIADAFHMEGWMWAATNGTQVGEWETTMRLIDACGERPYERLSRAEVVELTGSAQHLDGVYERTSATVQPARIARELARAVKEAGVDVYEHTQARALEQDGKRTKVTVPDGSISAGQVVLAAGAWAARIPEIGAGLVVVASDIIATERLGDRLAQAGPRPGLCISDGRRLVNYYHATADGRMIFGKGGGTLGYGNRVSAAFDHPGRRANGVRAQLLRTYPGLWDAGVAERWSGPVDYSLSGLPFFVRLRELPGVLVCAGFSGDGVGPSRLAGELLSEMVCDGGTAGLPVALRTVPRRALPPEPIRYLGGRLVRAAIARKEHSEDHGLRPRAVDRTLAALDPTGYRYKPGASER